MSEAMFRTPAEAYDRHVGRYGAALARELIAAAGVQSGRALDVGCGPGALTTELVTVLGAENVSAVDPSPPFAEACALRNPGVAVQVGAAEALPFGDASFDHVLSQLVVNFMSDARAGVREMRRVTRPGGMVAAAVWDYGGEMVLLRTFWDTAMALDREAADRDEARSMAYSTPGELGELWRSVGLEDVRVTSAAVAAGYESFEDLWSPLEVGVGPAGAYVVSLGPDQRAAFKDEFRTRLGVADRPFSLNARAWISRGMDPSR